MNKNTKEILDNYGISKEQYDIISKYLKCMDTDYHKGNKLSQYDYESFVRQLIGDKYSHYPAEHIAIELYKSGEFQELIKNVIYKDNIKVLSELDK